MTPSSVHGQCKFNITVYFRFTPLSVLAYVVRYITPLNLAVMINKEITYLLNYLNTFTSLLN